MTKSTTVSVYTYDYDGCRTAFDAMGTENDAARHLQVERRCFS